MSRSNRPNVLLIVLDTARADAFEPWGAATGCSPTVSQLASAGRLASSVMASSSWTVPSHASMFTGLLPRSIGLGRRAGTTPAGYGEAIRHHADRLLPTVLQRAGYRTDGMSANLWVSERSGFATGFDSFQNVETQRNARQGAATPGGRLRWQLEALRARADDGARRVERLLQGYDLDREQPFFCFVNLVECHSPYLPPAPYASRSWRRRWQSGLDASRHQTFEAFTTASLNGYDGSDEALERMRDQYRRAILLLDDWLARVLDRLDGAGVLDETLVIVTSDHGENFGECGLTGHSYSLDNRLIHVPLVAMGPGARAFDGMNSLVDLPARIARAIGLAKHPWTAVAPVPGVAVSQLDAFCGPDDPAVDEAVAALGLSESGRARLVTPLTSAVDGRWKLVERGVEQELFDLAHDPGETTPLQPDALVGAPVEALRAAIDAARRAEVGAAEHRAVPANDADMEEQLRLLGYL